MRSLEQLRFNLVGYGCTTCIGNSGPLSGARFEGGGGGRPGGGGGAERQSQFRGPHPRRKCGPITSPRRRWSSLTPWPAGWISICTTSRSARTRKGRPVYLRDIWPTQQEVQEAIERGDQIDDVPQSLWRSLPGRRTLELAGGSGRRSVPVGSQIHVRQASAVFREHDRRAAAGHGHPRGPRAGAAGRQHHDRPHFPGRLDQAAEPGRQVPAGARRRAEGFQLLRLAPRQRRSDGPRHLCQRPPAEPAGSRDRRRASRAICRTASRCRFTTRP